jgi:allantoinase
VVIAGSVRPATVWLEGGRIVAVEPWEDAPAGPGVLDAGDLVVLPGLVDVHVHVNEPGRTEWEGFETATRAAAAGGVTTLVDMPLNAIPATTTAAALATKRTAAGGRCRVDVGFWGGLVPANTDGGGLGEVAALIDAGVLGFKAFLVDSGVEEFPAATLDGLRRAATRLAAAGVPLLVHAEDPGVIARCAQATPRDGAATRSYAAYLASRPPEAEVEAIRGLLEICRGQRETGGPPLRLHVVHLSTAAALPLLDAARRDGLAVTVETCPHYLTFAAEEIPDGATEHKCAPPIRGAAEREALWRALVAGAIDLVASDHSPCPPAMKARGGGGFFDCWGGIASLQLLLPAVWTGARARGASASDLARWLSERPAALAGLAGRKGAIAAGRDADLVIWDPEASFEVEPARLEHRHPVTPYARRRLDGVVRATLVRGELVYDARDGRAGDAGEQFPGAPRGELLARSAER